ncbi:MAG: universal stress protein [Actinobacteria bacterium]|jgi:nucleotide-binding universal stress UspA family protein|nr:universal stress protein [Actinomycetota bacterium]
MASNDLPHDERPPRTVIVPLDGSAYAASALPYGQRLARRFGARVQTVTVGDPSETVAEVRLAGDPVEALLAHLAAADRAVVCMASHGHGGLRRRLLGSVAEALVRKSPHPVIVHGPEASNAGPPRSILAGLAWSPHLDQMVDTLSSWAPRLDAGIELAHVRFPSAAELYVARASGHTPPDQPDIGLIAERLTIGGARTSAHLLAGDDPVTSLLGLARRLPAPVLLAVATHQADERAHDDIAYRLIRRAPWPVLATCGS